MNGKKYLETDDNSVIFLNGLDAALVGVGERIGMHPIAVYDSQKCVEILMERYDMTYENALEFFDFNISGSYLGEYTPIFIRLPQS